MPNDFNGNPWMIDSITVARAGEAPAASRDLIRVRRVTLRGQSGAEAEIEDNSGRTVWEGEVVSGNVIIDEVNYPGGTINWNGFSVKKLTTGARLYISYR